MNLDETDEFTERLILKEGILIYSAPNSAERESSQETRKTGTTLKNENENIMLC